MATKGPKKDKPRPIEIVSVERKRKTIVIYWKQGDAKFDLEERDNPLPSFTKAMDALTPIVGSVCHLPKAWVEVGVVVKSFDIGESGDAPTVSFTCQKDIEDAQKVFKFVTPPKLLKHPTQPGKYTPPLDNEEAELVAEAIEEAKRYVKGERAQGEIEFEGEEEDESGDAPEPDNIEPLPGLAEEAPAKKKRSRGKVAAAGE